MPESVDTLLQRAHGARRAGRLADAHRDLVEAVAVGRLQGHQTSLIRALKGLAQIERDRGRVEAARPLYEEAVAICRGGADLLMLAHTVRHLGDLHQDAGRVTLAEPCYREALEIYREQPQTGPCDLANAIRPYAILKEAAGARDEARGLWEEAGRLYRAAGVEDGVVECADRLAALGASAGTDRPGDTT